MLYEGKIVQIDTPENIRNSTNPLIHQLSMVLPMVQLR